MNARSLRQHRVNRQQPCPICRKTTGCLLYDTHTVCLRVASDTPVNSGLGGWLHKHASEPSLLNAAMQVFTQPSSRLAPAKTLDSVYRELHSQLILSSAHQRHLLQERRLPLEVIQARAYRSWGQDRLQRRRLAELLHERFSGQLLDVPGILLREQDPARGPYITLGGPPGLLIPVRNADDQVVGHQIRTDNPYKSGKYVWLSSTSRGGPGPGSPVHVARPLSHPAPPSGRVWLTEGPLKADIACQHLDEIVLALPGVQAQKGLQPILERLREMNQIKELVIALDSDYHTKESVGRARKQLAERVARLGIPVLLADWTPNLKGLDDLLLAGGRPTLTSFQVSGNGPRPLEEVPNNPMPRKQKSVSIDQCRNLLQATLEDALEGRLGPFGQVGILLNAPPGSGKSTIVPRVLNAYHRNRGPRHYTAYFVPRHDLAQGPERSTWAFMQGRTRKDPETAQTPCAFPDRQQELARLHISGQLGCEHCPLLAACKDPAQPAPFYQSQFQQRAKVRVFPAQHFLSPSLWRNPAVVVLDDCDLKSLMLEELFLPQSKLNDALAYAQAHLHQPYGLAQPLLFALYELVRTAPAGENFAWSGAEFFQRLQQHCPPNLSLEQVLEQARQAEEPNPFEERTLEDGPRQVPIRFLEPLLEVLRHEFTQVQNPKTYNRRLYLERAHSAQEVGLHLYLRRDLPRQALEKSLLIISDASLTLEEARRLFPERQWLEIRPPVALPKVVNVLQRPEKGWGKVHLSKPGERLKALNLIGEIIEYHPYQRIGVITHQSFASVVRQRFPELHRVGHYHGQRGSNQFADCDVLLCFGTPNPNPQALERQAESLYWDGPTLQTQTLLQPRDFQQKGTTTLRTRVRTYVDPRLQEMLQAKREEELLQAIYRARPLSLDQDRVQGLLDFTELESSRQSVTIYVFSSLPLPEFEVQLQAQPPAPTQPDSQALKVIDLAAHRIWRNNQRLTDQRLREAAQTQRSQLLRWKQQRPHQLEAASPPSQAPPPAEPEYLQTLIHAMF